jgi:hypothetical protein
MKVYIDRFTNNVIGADLSSPSPLFIEVELSGAESLTKTVIKQEGMKQKLNEDRQGLYLKEIFRTETVTKVIGQDETLENTGNPIMIRVQKVDEQGNKLYLEPLREEDGTIVDYVEVTDPADENGDENDPIIIEVQKTSTSGKPLYWKDIVQTSEEQVLDHTEEVIEDTGVPVLLPNMVSKFYEFPKSPEQFNILDILEFKYKGLLDQSRLDYVMADMFLDDSDLDLADPKHLANTGAGLLQLLPQGQAKTKSITLEKPASKFQLLELKADEGVIAYVAGKTFIDGKIVLDSPISSCTIKFVNNSDKPKLVKSYAIGY